MSGPKWTAEQLAAIESRGCNLLVSAAAGAGKTAVLVERIIRRITDPIDPVDVDRLLIVTFTKAAAAEMRERISQAIVRELNKHPESVHLHKQLTLLTRASITTLHSFCLDVLRQYFYRVEIDPGFRVADDAEGLLLQLEALEEIFEEFYSSGNIEFLELVEAYGGDRDDGRLQEIILSLYRFAVSNPWPEAWLTGLQASYLNVSALESSAWGKTLLEWIELQLLGCQAKLQRGLELASRPGGPTAYVDNLQEDLVLVNDILQAGGSWQNLYEAFAGARFGKLKSCRDKDVDNNLKDQVKKFRDQVKKTVEAIRQEFFARPGEEYVADLGKVAGFVATITGLTAEFLDRYREIKAARGLVDFSDLEHYCLKILLDSQASPDNLEPSPVALELKEHFVEVMVDEYQDINAVQETVLQLVSGSNKFMVGDVKQSIYRFRLAEPGLFMGKYDSYPRVAGEPDLAIDLSRNFRSRPEVINAVNYVFRQLMTPRVGELNYDDKAELVCGAAPPAEMPALTIGGPVELHLLEKSVSHEDAQHGAQHDARQDLQLDSQQESDEVVTEDDPTELDAVQREARLTAARIRKLIEGQQFVFDKAVGEYRPVRFKDVVILMRATRGLSNTYMEELRAAGIPVFADLDTGYFAATEIETMLSLLKVIDNPRQDIPLGAVLRSPIANLDPEELAEVRITCPKQSYYDAVVMAARSGAEAQPAEETRVKLREFLARLEQWRTLARQGPLAQLIWRLYNETGYYSYAGGMPGGAQRQANLRALYDRARQYEATTYRGLFRFLRFIERFQDMGNDLGTARALGENEDVVRIMSIHKSKGLEFPVVIVTGLGRQFNMSDLRQGVLMHKELGLGLPVVEPDLRITYPSLVQAAIKRKLRAEMLAEEMRILYVALTRAREKLILIGSARDLAKEAARWCENVRHSGWGLPDADLAAAKNFLDWIGPVVARHRGGQELRQLAHCEDMPSGLSAEDPSCWEVRVWQPEDCVLPTSDETRDTEELLGKVKSLETVDLSAGKTEAIEAALNWSYPHWASVGKPAKLTVTELKRRFSQMEAEEEQSRIQAAETVNFWQGRAVRPRFMQEQKGLTPAERGSAMHLVMQHLDFGGVFTQAGIEAQVAAMLEKELLTKEQAAVVSIQAVARFFETGLGQRVLKADEVLREIPFAMAVPAWRLYPDIPESADEALLVQGVIDCLVREGEAFILIDYKSDFVNSLQEMVDRYQGQLKLYSTAVEEILGLPVKEKYLYLFSTGTALEIK